MERRRPRGRDNSGMGQLFSGSVRRRGSGLGSGPVGSGSGSNASRTSQESGSTDKGLLGNLAGGLLGGGLTSGTSTGGYSTGRRSGKGLLGLFVGFIIAVGIFGASCAGISLTGSGSNVLSGSSNGLSLFGGNSSTSSGWVDSSANVLNLNTSVAEGSRNKYTEIIGNGKDQVTVMVYMCGSDLETNSAMATKDLQEMAAAKIGDNVNVIVYTGGARKWQNNVISSDTNQIYRIKDGGLERLEANAGNSSMSDPATLASFIKWTNEKFPANRNELILWDHGGGSISGFAYDEKNAGQGYMTLSQINNALNSAGVKFDFVGFDACLMATVENGLMLNKYADYLIASEETEPGIGWYYTNWLTKLSEDPSLSTLEIGKIITDDFTSSCATNTPGQKTTLSVVDLAELSNTVPSTLTDFSKSLSGKITSSEYSKVSSARNNTREFAMSTNIDQIDLVHFAKNMNTAEGDALAEAIRGAVKYNRTSNNMTNAYGLSIYFPYKRVSNVDNAVATYNAIGMDGEYSKCIQEFAHLETAGQVSSGGSSSSMSSLFDILGGGSGNYGSVGNTSSLLNSFLGGNYGMIDGLSGSNINFLSGRALSRANAEEYVDKYSFDATNLTWETDYDGRHIMHLPEEQWDLVNSLDLNLFLDDGQGYIDLGRDNIFSYTEDGDLIADPADTWIGINGQTVAYYHEETMESSAGDITTGYVPALLNGKRVNIYISFDFANSQGYVSGVQYVYANSDTTPLAKTDVEIKAGDKIDFLCDYYSYDKKYNDSYMLGEQLVVGNDGLTITTQDMSSEKTEVTYMFTDIYNQKYWTPAVTD